METLELERVDRIEMELVVASLMQWRGVEAGFDALSAELIGRGVEKEKEGEREKEGRKKKGVSFLVYKSKDNCKQREDKEGGRVYCLTTPMTCRSRQSYSQPCFPNLGNCTQGRAQKKKVEIPQNHVGHFSSLRDEMGALLAMASTSFSLMRSCALGVAGGGRVRQRGVWPDPKHCRHRLRTMPLRAPGVPPVRGIHALDEGE